MSSRASWVSSEYCPKAPSMWSPVSPRPPTLSSAYLRQTSGERPSTVNPKASPRACPTRQPLNRSLGGMSIISRLLPDDSRQHELQPGDHQHDGQRSAYAVVPKSAASEFRADEPADPGGDCPHREGVG